MLKSNLTINRIDYVMHGVRSYKAGETRDFTGRGDHCELVYKIAGESIVTFRDESYCETGGTFRFLPVRTEADRYVVRVIEPGDFYYFAFQSPDAPTDLCRMTVRNGEKLEWLYEAMWRTWTMREKGYYHRCLAYAYEILAETERQSYQPSERTAILAPALDYIEKHLTDTIDCGSLHTLCGVSYTYFKSVFIERYGVPPKKYITRLKMNLACEQLVQGQLPVSAVAAALGYSNAHYFSRVFREEIGTTADEYRKRMKTI